ncbi:SDR family NAD(P)-dependent oxidoreductase, partial [Mycobacterium shimoidei]
DYWVVNLRNPVRFSQAVAAAAEKHCTFVEISPHPLLTHAIGDTLASTASGEHCVVTSAMKRGDDEILSVHTQLATVGVTPPKTDRRRLVNLPPTPWLHEKYWLESKPVAQRLPDVHPLLGVHVEMPSGRDHVWQADIGTESMPWLAQYKVHGQVVLPTACYVEMALAAARQAAPAGTGQIRALEIEQTLVLDRQTRITTQLSHNDGGYRVEIHASSSSGNWTRYAVADVDATGQDAPAAAPQADTELALPDGAADHPQYCLHPELLETALRHLAAGITAQPQDTPYLPVSVASIRVFGPVARRTRCHTELVEQSPGGYQGRIVFTDDTGTATAELTGIELRPVDPRAVALPLEHKIFDTAWMDSPLPEADSATLSGSWLLLADTDNETTALATDFASRFDAPGRRVIRAELGDESAVREAFADTAGNQELPPAGIVVFLGTRSFDGADTDAVLARAHDLIYSISAVAHAAVDGCKGKAPRLWLVTRNGLAVQDEPGDPAIGALKGLVRNWRFPGEAARVLAGEPDLGVTLVDIGSGTDAYAALLNELGSPAGDDVVAVRDERRRVERLTRASLDGEIRETEVRPDGAYIITGGRGGLGTVVTRWLLERGAGRLVLNGRTEPSDAQRQELSELANGAEIVFVAGDIAAPGVAERLVAAAEETGRPLRGVVHAAGVTGDGLVTALTRDGLQRVWAPKVGGALRLHAATAGRELDWWVGFSSMATLLGLPGQLAYTTANAWLDALVAWRRASGLPATAINWGQWSDVGMSRALTYSVLDPITPDEGIEALQTLVGGPLARVGVGRLRLDRALAATPEFGDLGFFREIVAEFDISSAPGRSAPDDNAVSTAPDWSQIPAENRLSELEHRLQAILARELRMSASAVRTDQPFPELGLDSMMAMTVLRETQKLVGIDLSANMLFNHPTISSLAQYLVDMHAPEESPEPNTADMTVDSGGSVLDELFDSVESASAGSESGIY